MWMRRTLGLSLALLVIASHAMAKDTPSEPQHQPPDRAKAKKPEPSKLSATRHLDRQRSERSSPERPAARGHIARRAAERSPDRYVGPVQDYGALKTVGQREVGSAAWYGGGHVGLRTATGEPLDAVRATAAHRSLPLNSLARVTNLNNGRSVIVRVTDRGPWSRSLLIDLSPRAADEIDMKRAGIVPVAIEPVTAVTRASVN